MTQYRYRAYDLIFASDRELPALADSLVSGNPAIDVTIVTGTVTMPEGATVLDEMSVAVSGDDVFLAIEDSGRYRISRGNHITVDAEPGVPFDQVSIYLLGTVFGVIIHQRGLLPMHCNAIEHEGRAFLFCGDSGAGKSTLAAYFQERGFRLLTDDVCPLRFDGGGIVALPGIARLKLWRQSLDLLGRSSDGLRQLPWNVDKYEIGMPVGDLGDARPVAAIYHLRDTRDGRPHGIHRLSGLNAANTVTANIYRRRVADLMGRAQAYLALAIRVMAEVPIFTVNRAWGLDHFGTEAALAEAHIRNFNQK